MKHTPRPYQRTAVDRVKASITSRPLLVAPTGSGKSFMGAMLADELGVDTLWLAHRKELVTQAADHLDRIGLFVGIIKAGIQPSPLARVQVASIQTLVRREPPPAKLVVIDEAHHAAADTYETILDMYPDAVVVGLTATPFRLDGRGLGEIFGELVVAARVNELVRDGWLHEPRVYACTMPDLSGVKITAGDFNLRALDRRANTVEQRTDIVREWHRHAEGGRTVAFAISVQHSHAIVAAFQSAGIAAEHLDGTTPDAERDAILGRLRDGSTRVVSNCMVLTEGWDLPELTCGIIARPTASLNLHQQMIGRVARTCEGKRGAVILDHAGNHHRHGLITREIAYSLSTDSRAGTSEPLGLRRCGACGLYFATHRFSCPECGWKPEAPEVPDLVGSDVLQAFDDDSHEYRDAMWREIEAERIETGRQEGWSAYRYKERFDVWPVIDSQRRLIDTANATMEQKEDFYKSLLAHAVDKGFKRGWASHKYRNAFGVWPRGFVQAARQRDPSDTLRALSEKMR